MRSLLCRILALAVLVAALSWAADGHAVVAEDHDTPAVQAFDLTDDHPPSEPDCDHHCHAGAHVTSLPVAAGDAVFSGASVRLPYIPWFTADNTMIPPGRPPAA